MSLKAFHIFFICASTLLALGYAVWEVNGYLDSGALAHLVIGFLSFVAAIGLVMYGVRFMRKLKHVGMI
jgi:hypothetical protein